MFNRLIAIELSIFFILSCFRSAGKINGIIDWIGCRKKKTHVSRRGVVNSRRHDKKSKENKEYGLNLEGCKNSEQTDNDHGNMKKELLKLKRADQEQIIEIEKQNNRIEILMKEVEKLKLVKEENGLKPPKKSSRNSKME